MAGCRTGMQEINYDRHTNVCDWFTFILKLSPLLDKINLKFTSFA